VNKRLLAGAAISAVSVAASPAPVAVCDGGLNQHATPIPVGNYVTVSFTPRCSNNVILTGEDKYTFYAASAASVKGRNVYIGSTAFGDMVVFSVPCASATACVANDVTQGQVTASAISS
jgi:hypothetical protein